MPDRFDGFISYHSDTDSLLAAALGPAIERIGFPWYRRSDSRIFFDRRDLEANPDLWAKLNEIAASARHFVLLASPGAADSDWVDAEIRAWRVEHKDEALLLVLTQGELVWDRDTGDFDWDRSTAIPEALRGAFMEEPKFVDLRDFREQPLRLRLRDSEFRGHVASLAAPIRGVTKRQVNDAEKSRLRSVVLQVAVAAIVLVMAVTLAIYFSGRSGAAREAEATAREAEESAREAEASALRGDRSRRIASRATAQATQNLDTALLLAAEAVAVAPTSDARSALLKTNVMATHIRGFLHGHEDGIAAISEFHGGRLATADRSGIVVVRHLADNEEFSFSAGDDLGRIEALCLHPDGTRLFIIHNRAVSTWTLRDADAKHAGVARSGELVLTDGVLSKDGSVLVLAVSQRGWRGVSRTKIDDLPSISKPFGVSLNPSEVYLERFGRRAAVPYDQVDVWNVVEERKLERRIATNGVDMAVFTSVGNSPEILITGHNDGNVRAWNLENGRSASGDFGHGGVAVTSIEQGPHRKIATGARDGSIRLWHTKISGEPDGMFGTPQASHELHGHGSEVTAMTFIWGDGSPPWLISGDDSGMVIVWEWLYPERNFGTALYREGAVVHASFGPGRREVSSLSRDGVVMRQFLGEGRTQVGTFPNQIISRDKSALSGTGNVSAAVVQDGTIEIWGDDLGPSNQTFSPSAEPQVLALDDRGTVLAVLLQDDAGVKVWSISDGNVLGVMEPDQGKNYPASVLCSGDGTRVARVDLRWVEVWATNPFGVVRRIARHGNGVIGVAQIDHSGDTVVTGDDEGRIVLFNVESGAAIGRPLTFPSGVDRANPDADGDPAEVTSFAFAPDSRVLASGHHSGEIGIWDTESGRLMGVLRSGPKAAVRGLRFGPEGNLLSSTYVGKRFMVWDLSIESLTERAFRIVGRSLDSDERIRFLQ